MASPDNIVPEVFDNAFKESEQALQDALATHMSGGQNARVAALYVSQVIDLHKNNPDSPLLIGATAAYMQAEANCELRGDDAKHCNTLRQEVFPATK